MTPNFELYDDSRQHFRGDSPAGNSGNQPHHKHAVNGLKRERFELLSAYLDSEVTSAERRQVESWLDGEPAVQRLHAQLLNLRHEIGTMPAPAQQQSVEQTLELVFAKLDSQEQLQTGDSLAAEPDRFELVSAYLDGEVTAAESRQVEEWLDREPAVQRLHAQLLNLRHEIETVPAPAPQQSVEQTLELVFAKLDSQAPTNAALAVEPDRFELVSAYVDSEVTAAERRQVESWLASEPAVQRWHAQLLNLHHEIETMPAPPEQQSVEPTLELVFAKLDSQAPTNAALAAEPDRFELVSAYLDGEVTAAERRQVEEWLANDRAVQRWHAQLLNLGHEIGTMPAPAPQQSDRQTLELVFAKLDSQAHSQTAAHALKRDRFELLSAYLDSEVTAAERRQVEDWLACDIEVQRLYARLLSLRSGWQNMPVPTQQPVEQTVEKVFARLERRPKLAVLWGGAAAVAAMLIAAVSGVLPGQQSLFPQQAANTSKPPVSSVGAAAPKEPGLIIALNDPLVPIPKPSAAPRDKSMVSRALIVE
jgi:anti-sigma factor RsiW